MSTVGFLAAPEDSVEADRMFADDVAEFGHVMNVSRLWAYQPATIEGLFGLLRQLNPAHGLSVRLRGVLVTACAAEIGDSYCSLAWGYKLANESGAATASAVLRGDDAALTGSERVLAAWARKVARDPSRTTATDVQALRDAGFTDGQIFAITVFVALRIAFSTVNDALGAVPDAFFRGIAPESVLNAVTYGRPIEVAPPAR